MGFAEVASLFKGQGKAAFPFLTCYRVYFQERHVVASLL